MNKLFLILASTAMMITTASCCHSKNSECASSDKTECESVACTNISATPEEVAEIRKTLNMYIHAAIEGNSKVAMSAFAQGATISHAEGDSLICAPIADLFSYFDATGKQPASYEISECSVTDDVAIVRIESVFGETEYTDMLTLVKDGDDWKIVSKIYHVK